MMFKRVLLLLAVLAALFVAPVVAYDNEAEIYETFYGFETFRSHDTHYPSTAASLGKLVVRNIENYDSIQSVFYRPLNTSKIWVKVDNPEIVRGVEPVTLRYDSPSGPIIAVGTVSYHHGETPETSHVRLDLHTWYGDVVGDDEGLKSLFIELPDNTNLRAIGSVGGKLSSNPLLYFVGNGQAAGEYRVEYTYTKNFQPIYRTGSVTMTDDNGVTIYGFKVTAVNHYTGEEYTVATDTDVAVMDLPMDRTTEIRNPQTGEYEESPVGYYRFFGQSPGYKMLFDDGIKVSVMPEKYGSYKFCDIGVTSENGFTSTLRRGTVTMTDHNGTAISGFEVTAVNAYTGESHTVSTDTDVAVMDLPMDRTTEIRNPQTGIYEEAPVGYYTFYGQKPGYKMLHEDGIRVMVMPEKYGSYKFCDILVSSESGPLTGKHQFQLRSWSDFSILQTGTLSAKSRTTGIWYNTTVVDGIATLILPYDTSDAISEHAGHYYVYATSPGYEDSDYGIQIAVYPHTVSEIRTILLTPIGGVPTPGNVTLRIQAISETGQGVPNAEIFIAGVLGAGKDVWDTYTTSWTGFIEVSVPGNSTYDIVARGAGYYDSSRRIEVFTEDPPIIEMYLFLSGAPTVEPTTEPTGWVTGPPATQPTDGIPDEDDDSDGFMIQAVRGIANLFGVSFGIGKIILGMLLALGIGTATAKQLRGGAQEFGMGMLGGVVLGVLIGLLPIWVLVLLVLIVGLWIGQRYMSGGDS